MSIKIHELKTVQPYYDDVMDGLKTFEIRKNDRGFCVGEYLCLREYDPTTDRYTGDSMMMQIAYITDYEQKEGYVVMAIRVNHD